VESLFRGEKNGRAIGNRSNIAATVAEWKKTNLNDMPTRKPSELRAVLTETDIDRIIEMAWEDRTPFDAILAQFGVSEAEVIVLMKAEMRLQNWKKWRARVQNRATKHLALRDESVQRFRCDRQRQISSNRIAKRIAG
jgi:uncharacterized protein (TIGR03643 family)